MHTPVEPARLAAAQGALKAGESLSPDHSRALMEETAFGVRERLFTGGPSTADNWSADRLMGMCGKAQALSHYRLRELGVAEEDLLLHQAADAFDRSQTRHSFLAARLPGEHAFLADLTFRQFFQPGPAGEVGRRLNQTPEGTELANQVLRHGFVDLNDTTAGLYGKAFSADPAASPARAKDLLRHTEKQGLDLTDAELGAFWRAFD